jgi:uncharacterized NAD-dependent epimerase/dehydratase family protein
LLEIQPPYLIFVGDANDGLTAKTGQGIVDWRPQWALAQCRLPQCNADLGIPEMSVQQAAKQGAKTFVIGTVNFGGVIPPEWTDIIVSALENGMDVASGLHTPLESIAPIELAARRCGRRLLNVRHPNREFKTGSGAKRSGKRLLTVGTDCSIGKMYSALCIERDMRQLGIAADFRATGQTGIFIAGGGVAVDAVVADFISGAAEWLTPAAADDHWDIVEGQGSLFHPAFAGVSMGLLHGTQPDAFVVCHEPTRRSMLRIDVPMPSLEEVIDLTLSIGRVVNPAIRCVGISINTHQLSQAESERATQEAADRLSLPATDPMKFGVRVITDYLMKQQ